MAESKNLRLTLCFLLAIVAGLCATAIALRESGNLSAPEETRLVDTPFRFPEHLRIATYNLNGFRDENRFSDDGKFRYKYPKSEKSKRTLYETVLAVRPDVLAVQEIGGNAWLEEFSEALAHRGLPFPYRVCLNAHDEYNRLAILSRVPFSKTIEIQAPEKLTRGLLGIVIPVTGGNLLHVYNVHLKSKVSTDPDDPECNERRSREARYLRRLIELGIDDEITAKKIPSSVRFKKNEFRAGTPPKYFLLLGDLNDTPGSKPLASLEVETFARTLPAKNDDGGILTYFNPKRGYFHTFDRIFASPALFKHFYVPDSAKIFESSQAQTASDHRLVYADFDFTETARRVRKSGDTATPREKN